MDELNVRQVEVVASGQGLVELIAKPDYRRLGPRLGARMGEVAAAIAGLLSADQIEHLAAGGGLELAGTTITGQDLVIQRISAPGTLVASAGQLTVALDTTTDPEPRSGGLGAGSGEPDPAIAPRGGPRGERSDRGSAGRPTTSAWPTRSESTAITSRPRCWRTPSADPLDPPSTADAQSTVDRLTCDPRHRRIPDRISVDKVQDKV